MATGKASAPAPKAPLPLTPVHAPLPLETEELSASSPAPADESDDAAPAPAVESDDVVSAATPATSTEPLDEFKFDLPPSVSATVGKPILSPAPVPSVSAQSPTSRSAATPKAGPLSNPKGHLTSGGGSPTHTPKGHAQAPAPRLSPKATPAAVPSPGVNTLGSSESTQLSPSESLGTPAGPAPASSALASPSEEDMEQLLLKVQSDLRLGWDPVAGGSLDNVAVPEQKEPQKPKVTAAAPAPSAKLPRKAGKGIATAPAPKSELTGPDIDSLDAPPNLEAPPRKLALGNCILLPLHQKAHMSNHEKL